MVVVSVWVPPGEPCADVVFIIDLETFDDVSVVVPADGCIVVSNAVCEFDSELDCCCCCCCCGSSVNRNAISKSRKTSVSLGSIKLKRLQTKKKLKNGGGEDIRR